MSRGGGSAGLTPPGVRPALPCSGMARGNSSMARSGIASLLPVDMLIGREDEGAPSVSLSTRQLTPTFLAKPGSVGPSLVGRPRRGAGHAPAPSPLPPRPWHAAWPDGTAGTSPGRTGRCRQTVPRHGDELLATPGRGGAVTGGSRMAIGGPVYTSTLVEGLARVRCSSREIAGIV
jgi:hypothetical protein